MEMSFRPNLPQDLFERINRYKEKTGVTKTHMVTEALEKYLDIAEGKAHIVYGGSQNEETKHA